MKAGDRVGIVGIGGLGHLAIQFANKLGAETVVFLTSKAKEVEARAFGASELYLLDEPEHVSKPVDLLLITGLKHPDWSKFMVGNVIERQGTIISLAVPLNAMELPGLPMIFNGDKLGSTLVASRQLHNNMLNFVARHGIKPVIETFEMSLDGFSQALKMLETNTIRYRGVLVDSG